MLTARSVTGLTAHIDLCVLGVEPVVDCVVAFFDIGAVALGAAGIPIKESARPMQGVSGRDALVGIQVVPPLPTLTLGPCIPGDRERLQPAVAQGQQILLQWLNPENILDRIRFQVARGIVGLDEKGVPFWLKVVVKPK